MPSPLAHPAAAIPFTKAKLVFSALVFGSLAPDFWYVFRVGSAYFSYTFLGQFLFNLPVGLILLVVFQTFMKWPLLSLLPKALQRRLETYAEGFRYGPIKHFGVILLSLLVGSVTHTIWDSFTHEYGWLVEHVPFLSTPISGTPLYDILQTISSLLGIIILVYWFFRWLPHAQISQRLPKRFSFTIQAIFAVLAAITLAGIESLILYNRFRFPKRMPLHFMLGGSLSISAFLTLFFFIGLYCLVWTIVNYKGIPKADL